MTGLTSVRVRNFRSLADVSLAVRRMNVLFGPNASGKSTLLEAIWLLHDCLVHGVDEALSRRNYGAGMLWDGARPGEVVSITVGTRKAEYTLQLGYSSGRAEPFAGELLRLRDRETPLLERNIGSDKARFYRSGSERVESLTLRDPEKLALARYLDATEHPPDAATELEHLLRSLNLYYSRGIDLYGLKTFGSEVSHRVRLEERGRNLWTVLRNLHDRRTVDTRYDTIVGFLRRGFPGLRDLLIEQVGPNAVYGNFIERNYRKPIEASAASDGYIQMLALLAMLFATQGTHPVLLLFDEPEISLHPYALAVFASAVRLATEEQGRQVFIATHSPVLISQFAPADILAMESDPTGRTVVTRVSEMSDIADLLEEYAVGSLYMAEMIAPQSRAEAE